MAFYDYHKYEAKLTQREINAYEDWKDSPERYAAIKPRCCVWLHSSNEPCPTEPPCCIYYHPKGTPCPVDKAASAATAE